MPSRYNLVGHQRNYHGWRPVVKGKEHQVDAFLGDWLGDVVLFVDGELASERTYTWLEFDHRGEVTEVVNAGERVERAVQVYIEFPVDGETVVITGSGLFSFRYDLSHSGAQLKKERGIRTLSLDGQQRAIWTDEPVYPR